MKMKTLVGVGALAALLTACGGGDINIDAQNNAQTDNSVGDNSNNVNGGGGNTTPNPCAQYSAGSIVRQGSYDSTSGNCTYGTDFVDLTNPITTTDLQVTFADLPNDGVHIFRGSLVVGRNYDNDADMAAAGITKGGDGAAIRLDAGATLAFASSDDYMVINRGSQIFAEGSADKPVVITSVSDAVDHSVAFDAVSEWGGLIINGFGVTNKCSYTGTRGVDLAKDGECHVAAEGKSGSAQTHYGGDNDADNSGVLSYFIVKHTGAQVAVDNELNGISFDAVGSGTTVNYLQAYSTYDDGVEMFGGAVNISNYVALYVRDDSIDIDEGYRGTFSHALVIQSEQDGQQCVESDGIGSYNKDQAAANADRIARGLNSAANLWHITCIVSPNNGGTHGVGGGMRIREGHFAKVHNSVVTTAYGNDEAANHECVRVDDPETLQGAQDGNVSISASIFACADLSKGGPLPDTTILDAWLATGNDTMMTAVGGQNPSSDTTDAASANIVLFEANSFYSLPLTSLVVNGNVATITPVQEEDSANPETYIGAVTSSDDWTTFAYGLHDGNRAQALWFE